MRIGAGTRKLILAGVFLLLVAGLWVGLGLLPERAPEERRQIADLFDRADFEEGRGRLGDAATSFREALALAERVKDVKAQIGARIGLARLAAAHEQYGDAVRDLSSALDLARDLKDPGRTATVLNNLGEVARGQGNLPEARRLLREALDLARPPDKTRAAVLNNLGEVARAEGRFDEALEYYRQSMAVNEDLEYKPGLAANLANVGAIHLARGNMATAIAWLERAHRMAFDTGDRLAAPLILTTLSQAYVAAGRTTDAMVSLIEARDQYLLLGLEARAAALTRQIREGGQAGAGPVDAPPARRQGARVH